MAIDAINRNTSVLRQYQMDLLVSDGQCSADMVMKTFINYLRMPIFPQMAGVLGELDESKWQETLCATTG